MKHPVPSTVGLSNAYFRGGGSGNDLWIPWCDQCHLHVWPQRWRCRCGCALTTKSIRGEGTVVSWSVVRRAVHPELETEVPYLVGFVSIAPGIRIFTNFVEIDPEEIHIGMKVRSRTDSSLDSAGECLAIPVFVSQKNSTDRR